MDIQSVPAFMLIANNAKINILVYISSADISLGSVPRGRIRCTQHESGFQSSLPFDFCLPQPSAIIGEFWYFLSTVLISFLAISCLCPVPSPHTWITTVTSGQAAPWLQGPRDLALDPYLKTGRGYLCLWLQASHSIFHSLYSIHSLTITWMCQGSSCLRVFALSLPSPANAFSRYSHGLVPYYHFIFCFSIASLELTWLSGRKHLTTFHSLIWFCFSLCST